MKRNWTPEEDTLLTTLLNKHGKQWGVIASHFSGRTTTQIASRWEKCLDPTLHKGPFTQEEDQLILNFVSRNGPRCWPQITSIVANRTAKQCRERWFNHLSPDIVKTEWTQQEDELIFQYYTAHGGKWSAISKLFPGRSDNAIKNRWNSSVSKRLQRNAEGLQTVVPDTSKRKYKPKDTTHPVVGGEMGVDAPSPRPAVRPPPMLDIPTSYLETCGPFDGEPSMRANGWFSPTISTDEPHFASIIFGDFSSPKGGFLLSPTKLTFDGGFMGCV
jgi:hypothetical protein